ncbi:MAG: recombinase family protein [Christensenellaceae bacterium]|nr:MAG: recombinase family protein [Clostridiales bacterium]
MNVIDITPLSREKAEKIRLAAYARVSSKSEEQLHSFAAQVQYYSEYVKDHPEYELIDIYADEGITGTEMSKRKELNRLLRDCKNGKVDRIITKSVSRFARNTEELIAVLRMLKELGVSVYFEEQGIDSEKLNMEMIVTFPGLAAQKESEAISGNLRWSFQKRMESGEYNCTFTPYGYERINGEMVIKESEAAVVRRIYELYLNGTGIQTIKSILNEEKVPKRYGKTHWHHSSIKYILTNERYKGDALLQKKYTTETLPYRRRQNKGEYTQYYVENSNIPIISKEVFERVQELLKFKKNEKSPYNHYLLSRKLICPECGGAFRRQQIEEKVYWLCMKTSLGYTECQSRRVQEDMVYETFTDMLYKLKHYQDQIIGSLLYSLEQLQNRTSQNQERVRQLDKEIADLAAKNLIVTRLHTSGILDSSEYSAQTSEIENRLNELRSERRKKLSEDEDPAIEELKELNEIMEEYQPSSRFNEELFEQIVPKIIVDDSTKITFHLLGGLELTQEINEKGRCKVV